jgi:hypothetical protein
MVATIMETDQLLSLPEKTMDILVQTPKTTLSLIIASSITAATAPTPLLLRFMVTTFR